MSRNDGELDAPLVSNTEGIFSRVPLDVRYPPSQAEGSLPSRQEFRWLDDMHPLARQRTSLALPDNPSSVAVIDWNAARNTIALFEDVRSIRDPFIATLDFATVVGGLLFYDRLLLLDYDDVASRLNGLFRLDDTVQGIDPKESSRPGIIGMRDLIERYFLDAQTELDEATVADRPWIGWLREAWGELLPHNAFPRHDSDAYDQLHGHYSGYDDRTDVAFDALFNLRDGSYRAREVDFNKLILDNDARSLCYEIMLEQFRIYLDPRRILTFRYLANPLRTPIQLARARLALAELRSLHPPAEDWLQEQWAQLLSLRAPTLSLQVPFWLNAVLATAPTRQDVPGAVHRLRQQARRFRARRRKIEEDLFAGHLSKIDSMKAALQGDINRITEEASAVASGMLDVSDTAMKSVTPLPFGPKAVASLAAPVSANWFRQQWLRLFRPQLWVMYDLGQRAQRVTRILPLMFERFELPNAYAAEPAEFLTRFSRFEIPV
ncbi:hypothetical protein [Streptomyces sp. NPDC052012]|uniref:hypothetical protein n=1 Tax=Streptomyces sp. NPDC052012 TaxID=3155051 RepID=UPI00344BC580